MPTFPEQQAAGASSLHPARTSLIEAARSGWIGRLIDTSRRNNLIYYHPTAGSIELLNSSQPPLDLLAGKTVSAQALLPDADNRPGRVLSIARKALENSEEKGLQTLYLSLGFASWTANDGGRDARAPIFLLPLQMKKKGRDLDRANLEDAPFEQGPVTDSLGVVPRA